jgi:DNA-binding XRE family transcriptional regulator
VGRAGMVAWGLGGSEPAKELRMPSGEEGGRPTFAPGQATAPPPPESHRARAGRAGPLCLGVRDEHTGPEAAVEDTGRPGRLAAWPDPHRWLGWGGIDEATSRVQDWLATAGYRAASGGSLSEVAAGLLLPVELATRSLGSHGEPRNPASQGLVTVFSGSPTIGARGTAAAVGLPLALPDHSRGEPSSGAGVDEGGEGGIHGPEPRVLPGKPNFTPARVRAARKRAGWTQCELARRVGVSPGTISRWERGATTVPESQAARLLEVFGGEPLDETRRRRLPK